MPDEWGVVGVAMNPASRQMHVLSDVDWHDPYRPACQDEELGCVQVQHTLDSNVVRWSRMLQDRLHCHTTV